MRASEIDVARRNRARHVARTQSWWLVAPLILGAILTLVELEMLSLPTWELYSLIAAIPAVAVVDNRFQSSREKGIGARKDVDFDRYKACVALAAEVHDSTGIDFTIIGVSVWGIYSPKRWRLGGGQADKPSLYRLTRFRISAHPMPSNSSWVKGRGAIGRCWETEEPVFADWDALRRPHAGATSMSESKWRNLSEDRRWGFERERYLEAIRKYAQVLAVPIKDEHGVFIGCVSVDIPTADVDVVPAVPEGVTLGAGKVRSSMTLAANSLSGLV